MWGAGLKDARSCILHLMRTNLLLNCNRLNHSASLRLSISAKFLPLPPSASLFILIRLKPSTEFTLSRELSCIPVGIVDNILKSACLSEWLCQRRFGWGEISSNSLRYSFEINKEELYFVCCLIRCRGLVSDSLWVVMAWGRFFD